MRARQLVVAGAFATLLSQAPAASQTRLYPTVLTARADAFGWAPDGDTIAYSDGPQLIVAYVAPKPIERCRLFNADLKPPILAVQWSPDGRYVAFIATRKSDDWYTIWLSNSDCATARDLLPLGVGPESPGIRAVSLSTWVDSQTIAFTHYCGPGCHALNTIRVDNRVFTRSCATEGPFYWNRTGTRAVAETHLGGLALISDITSQGSPAIRNCTPTLAGCGVVNGMTVGMRHQFDSWGPDEQHVFVTDISCNQRTPDVFPALSLWDTRTDHTTTVIRNASSGAVSPDSRQLAYVAFERNRATGSVSLSLVIGHAITYRPQRIMPLGMIPGGSLGLRNWEDNSGYFRPHWSADGRHLTIRDAKQNVRVVNADTGEQQLSLGDVETSWAPGGQLLAISNPKSRTLAVVIIP